MISDRNCLTNCDEMSMSCWSHCLLKPLLSFQTVHLQYCLFTFQSANSIPLIKRNNLLSLRVLLIIPFRFPTNCESTLRKLEPCLFSQYWWVNCLIMTSKMPFQEVIYYSKQLSGTLGGVWQKQQKIQPKSKWNNLRFYLYLKFKYR